MGDPLIYAPSLMFGKIETMYKAVSWALCAFLILCSHVLALPDDNASSQHLMPKPSLSVTNPTPAGLRLSAWMRSFIIGRIVHP